jgi:hypothetical protein
MSSRPEPLSRYSCRSRAPASRYAVRTMSPASVRPASLRDSTLRAMPRWPASSSKRRTPLATSRSTSSVQRSPMSASVLAIEQVSLS